MGFSQGEEFRQSRGGISEGVFMAISYSITNNSWRCTGYDLHSKSWRSLPPLLYLPPPDAELFKEYNVCGHGGLMCAEVSKLPKQGELVEFRLVCAQVSKLPEQGELVVFNPSGLMCAEISKLPKQGELVVFRLVCAEVSKLPKQGELVVFNPSGLMCAEVSELPNKGELVVFNPSTEESQALPPLLHPRNAVLVHISVDSAKNSYKVIAAGSSAASDEHLSRKVEVFDSSTSKWKEVCDVPGPASGLNEHQAGVCLNGKLFFISFLESGDRRVVVFDVENGKWLQDLTVPIPWSSYSNTLQLVESDGKLFVFSEQEPDQSVDHCIDELEFLNPKAGVKTCRWRSFVKVKKPGGRGLQVYPEHTCVGFGEGKLCIFNTLSRDAVVYDMRDGKKCEDLVPPPANQMGDNFFSLNPATLVESDGKLFVISEQQRDQSVDHCIEKVGFPNPKAGVLGIFSTVCKKLLYCPLYYLFASVALMPNGVRAEDQSIQDFLQSSVWKVPISNTWESPDFVKIAAVTLLAVGAVIGAARVAWGIFRRRRAPGNRFDIMQGLEDSDTPTRGDPLFEFLPPIPA